MMENKPELSAGWKWVRLGEVCEFSSGIWGEELDDSNNCYFVLRSNNIKDGKMIFDDIAVRKIDPKYIESKSLKYGDILVTTSSGSRDLLGKSAIFIPPDDKVYLFSNFTMKLRVNILLADYIYVFLYLQSPEAKKVLQLLQDTTTGLRNLDRREFMNQFLPLPPLSEQKWIAAKLQEIMEEIDQARTACEKQLEAAKSLPSAYLREALESPESQTWERKKLGEVCKIFNGSSAPQDEKYFENGKFPFVRVSDLGNYGRTTNLTEVRDYINELCIRELNIIKASKGTILFPKSGAAITTNNRAILGIDAYIVSHLAALKPKENIADTYFVYYWLCLTDMIQYMENLGYPSLKLSTISKILIPLPPLSEQKRIAAYLKEKIDEAEKLRASIEKELETINVLPQSILSKAFKGEI